MPELNNTPTNTPEELSEVAAKALPEIPEYITYGFMMEYLEACSEEVQNRFQQILTNAGMLELVNKAAEETPDEGVRTVIAGMFMAAI